MRTSWPTVAAVAATLALSRPAFGFDPMIIDILTFRLGMTEPDILSHLHAQGVDESDIRRLHGTCIDRATECFPLLVGRMKDGVLAFAFLRNPTDEVVAGRITYRFPARGAGEPAAIRLSVLDRYGTPNGVSPTSWCLAPDPSRHCLAAHPRLSVENGPGTMVILTLSDGHTQEPVERPAKSERVGGHNQPASQKVFAHLNLEQPHNVAGHNGKARHPGARHRPPPATAAKLP
jgi:hypothetical protein